MTRTPDCHFAAEARHNGTQDGGLLARLQPGGEVRRRVDRRSTRARTAPGGWRSTTCSSRSSTTSGRSRTSSTTRKRYTDAPFLVELERGRRRLRSPGSCCAPAGSPRYAGRGARRLEVPDVGREGRPAARCRMGSVGLPLGPEEGQVEPASSRTASTARPSTRRSRSSSSADEVVAGATSTTSARAQRSRAACRSSALTHGRRHDGAGRHGLRPADGAVRRAAAACRATTRPTTTTRRSPTRRPGRRSTPASAARPADPLRARVGHDRRADRTASAPSSSAPASTTGTTAT